MDSRVMKREMADLEAELVARIGRDSVAQIGARCVEAFQKSNADLLTQNLMQIEALIREVEMYFQRHPYDDGNPTHVTIDTAFNLISLRNQRKILVGMIGNINSAAELEKQLIQFSQPVG